MGAALSLDGSSWPTPPAGQVTSREPPEDKGERERGDNRMAEPDLAETNLMGTGRQRTLSFIL